MTGTFLSSQILPLKGKWEALRQRRLNITDFSVIEFNDSYGLNMQGNKGESTKQRLWSWPLDNEKQNPETGLTPVPQPVNTSYHEDDMLAWLQYPMEEQFGKSYCSELFGGISTSGPVKDPAVSRKSQAGGTSYGICQLSKSPDADMAMALGAERAAGLSSQIGLEAFCKVRTSVQPPVPKWSSPPALAPPATCQAEESPVMVQETVMDFQQSLSSQSMATQFSVPTTPLSNPSPWSVIEKSTPFAVESLTLPFPRHEDGAAQKPSIKIEPTSFASAGGSPCWKSKSSNNDRRSSPGKKKVDSNPSSSGDSENTGGRPTEKRKLSEVTESTECQSEELEAESTERKKQPVRPKRSRAAEVHNLSERRRRDRINEKMRALQELIPNSNKTDKASMLDEAIEYLKMLQLQLQMMSMRSGMSIPPMVGIQPVQVPQMPAMPYGVTMGMGIGVGMNMGIGMGVNLMDVASPSIVKGSTSSSMGEVNDPPQHQHPYVPQVPLHVINRDLYSPYMIPTSAPQHSPRQQQQVQQQHHHQQQQQHQQQHGRHFQQLQMPPPNPFHK